MYSRAHGEVHRGARVGWLRAAVLGAQDGVVSTSALVIGVAAASSSRSAILVAGIAALVAGAMSMATGEYNSVSSQRDTELADIARERHELTNYPEHELEELTTIYVQRGLDRALAAQVAEQMTCADPLGAHMRDELGLHEHLMARPIQAAVVSSTSFASGAALSLAAVALAPAGARIAIVAAVTMVLLAGIGLLGARLGGAKPLRAVVRLTALGGIAMVAAAVVGDLAGAVV
ncbi:MAG: VIT family protein [Actinobacteria bacterium]|nr:VIT family protein [Actinomycetota bacterium]